MLELLRNWLNGKREYWTGVALYQQSQHDPKLLQLFHRGKTETNHTRLQEELLKICKQLKSVQIAVNTIKSAYDICSAVSNIYANDVNKSAANANKIASPVIDYSDTELYKACKSEADLLYKKLMNERAVLFAKANNDGIVDINTPDKIEQRSKPAVSVVVMFQTVSKLYDKADFVKKNGRLPNDVPVDDEDREIEALPDSLVKQKLDNARKNFSKMTKREQTPERIALQERNLKTIKKLEARWLLLKPEK